MNFLHKFIVIVVPYMISILEIIGIVVVFGAGLFAFWQFCQNTFRKKHYDLQSNLAKGLAMGLEFKMAAEILRTVLIQSLEELYMLGAVILLRALLSVLIHFEIKHANYKKAADNKQPSTDSDLPKTDKPETDETKTEEMSKEDETNPE